MLITLNDKNVGDIVKIRESGTAVNYIIVHKGKPSNMYDDSCDGVWLLRQNAYPGHIAFDADNCNDYENSDIHSWLNGEYLNSIDPRIREVIRTVKIPFKKGTGNGGGSVLTGANGLTCRVFLLAGYEVGFTASVDKYFPVDGAKLSYFLEGNTNSAKSKRICCENDTAAIWWLRSQDTNYDDIGWVVMEDGGYHSGCAHNVSQCARPAFVLSYDLLVDSDDFVSTNTLPVITSDKTGDLGTLTSGLSCNYSINDEDAEDSVTVTLTLDDTRITQFTAVKEQQYAYSLAGSDWLKITNGKHTFKIEAADGRDTVESTAVFTRDQTDLSVMLETPFEADDTITACSLDVEGMIPADALCKYEVTNNALDDEPVWEDCTARVKAGFVHMFKNKTAANGFAFSVRISIRRGMSGIGGYITKISGGFE